MKQSDVTYKEKLNELRMDLQHPRSHGIAFALVEGDSDIRLLRKFFRNERCKVERIPGGKPSLLQCIEELKAYVLIFGICDADFDNLDGVAYGASVFLTDCHDMEMTIIKDDPTFESLMHEAMVHNYAEFRGRVISTIENLSLLKWLNMRESLELNFRPSFSPLISCAHWNMSIEDYIDWVLAKSPQARNTSRASLLSKMDTLRLNNPDCWQLTNGHDFFRCASKYLKDVYGMNHMNEDSLHAFARVAYSLDRFKTTTLYTNISHWCSKNGCDILN